MQMTLVEQTENYKMTIPPASMESVEEDWSIIAAVKSGDSQAFEILVKRHQWKIFNVVLRITRNRHDAEDVVQQSLQKAFVKLRMFEGNSSFSTWLTRIAINEALMWLRKKRGSREVSVEQPSGNERETLSMDVPDLGPSPEERHNRREQKEILSLALKQLCPDLRNAIQLKELNELSLEETAKAMGISLPAAKARVFRARAKLRDKVRRYVNSAHMSRKTMLRITGGNGVSGRQFA